MQPQEFQGKLAMFKFTRMGAKLFSGLTTVRPPFLAFAAEFQEFQ
jgi:hypothetical protein